MARPKKEISWLRVEQMMESGASAKEIAGALAIDLDTFYSRFKEEFGKGFSDYSDSFRSGGYANLRHMQYVSALKGNSSMLQYLGRIWLGQKTEEEAKNISTFIIKVNDDLRSGIDISA